MRVFVTGGTGLIGRRLVRRLLGRGDQPVVLTRRYAIARQMFGPDCGLVEGDPMQAQDEWMNAAADCDGAVNLAGENIFNRRWNAAFKQRLRDSRVKSSEHVAQALSRQPRRADGQPRVLVNASAIGFYGPHGDEELTEDSPAGDDFLAELCVAWEKAARAVESSGVRCALVRVGIVLDKEGGALAQMLTPFKLCLGGPVGNGRQYMSWIHHEDMTGVFLHALDNPAATGPLNGTAPAPVTNREFSKALGRALHRPAFMPLPRFALRLRFGKVADVLATGQRVLPRRTLSLGYTYRFSTIDAALNDIVG
jgi:uncharacterized protein (TIGR01777 family)